MDPNALYRITYGMYIVTACADGRHNGQTANTVFQISNAPPTIAVSINKENLTHRLIREGGRFAVSVLHEEAPLSLIGQFGFRSGRDIDKFEDTAYSTTSSGLRFPTAGALACMEARVLSEADGGTHTVFLGEVTDASIVNDEVPPMTYAHYRLVKKGTAPKTAPIGVR